MRQHSDYVLCFCIFSFHYFLFPKLNICGWCVIGNFFYPFVQKTKKNSNDIGIGMQKCESFYFYGRHKKVTLSNSMKTSTYFPFVTLLRVTTTTIAGFCVSFLWIFLADWKKLLFFTQASSKNLKVFSGFLTLSSHSWKLRRCVEDWKS